MNRPRRVTRPPITYWEEYIEKDNWYVAKLVEDVPEEEMHAACVDDNFEDDEGEEEEESELETDTDDGDFLECDAEADDTEYVPVEDESVTSSEEDTEIEDASDDSGSEYSSDDGEEDETLHGSTEGECRSESSHGEGASGAVGEERPRTIFSVNGERCAVMRP